MQDNISNLEVHYTTVLCKTFKAVKLSVLKKACLYTYLQHHVAGIPGRRAGQHEDIEAESNLTLYNYNCIVYFCL